MICTRDKAVQAAWTAAGLGALIAAALTLRRWGFDTAGLDGVYYTVYPARVSAPMCLIQLLNEPVKAKKAAKAEEAPKAEEAKAE